MTKSAKKEAKLIDPLLFIEVYMEAFNTNKDMHWVGGQLGIAQKSVYNRYRRLKDRGVKLPRVPASATAAGTVRRTVNEMNKMVDDKLKEHRSGNLQD